MNASADTLHEIAVTVDYSSENFTVGVGDINWPPTCPHIFRARYMGDARSLGK